MGTMKNNAPSKRITKPLQNLTLCKFGHFNIILKYLFSARKIRSTPEHNTVLNHTNREQFITQLTSLEGYFLISTFQFHNEQGEQKLDDAILHALLNGIIKKLHFICVV
jgi:hypothetical protein